jgi:hypothetical protein
MRAWAQLAPAASLVVAITGLAIGGAATVTAPAVYGQTSATCNLSQVAFCDTFDQPFTGAGRTGQLDPSRWTVSRHSGLNGSGMFNMFVPSDAMRCRDRITGVVPPNDVFMCGPEFGESMHFMDAFSAGGSYIYNNFRIRQPLRLR